MNAAQRSIRNAKIIADYNNGVEIDVILKEHNITAATVYTVLRNARANGIVTIHRKRGRRLHCNPARDAAIIAAYQDGNTLEAIGQMHGLTRERIRQIIKRSGIATHRHSVVAYQRWADGHGERINETFDITRSIARTIALHPEAPASWVRRLLRPRAHESHSGRTANPSWTSEDMLAALRAAATNGVITTTAYSRWRRDGGTIDDRVGPAVSIIVWRFGSWRNAAEQAGLQVGFTPRAVYIRQWTREDAIASVKQYIREADTRGIRPSYAGYDAWASENPGHPSAAYLRYLVNQTWSETLTEVRTSDTVAAG